MKVIIQDNDKFLLRFDKDEEVFAGLVNFMKEQAISACVFSGVGACGKVELGYFNVAMKDYRKKPYVEELEIISFSGSGSLKDGEPVLHAHGHFGRNDFTSIGGHIFSLTVSVTAEIFLTKLNGQMNRQANSEFNLDLLV